MNTFPRLSSVGALAAASVLLFNPVANADIVANFTGGDGFESVDQYQGIPGDGWATAWQTNTAQSSAGTSLVGFVDESAPMNNGGKYLSTFPTGGSGVSKGAAAAVHHLDNVNILEEHTVSFDLRLDLDTLDTHGEHGLLPAAFDCPFTSDFGANGAWLILRQRRIGQRHPRIELDVLQRREDGGAFNAANFVDSGISLVSGLVYHFVINIDPVNLGVHREHQRRRGIHADGFRHEHAGKSREPEFRRLGWSDAGEVLAYSLDSVDVAPVAVPEPSTIALSLCAGVAGVIGLRGSAGKFHRALGTRQSKSRRRRYNASCSHAPSSTATRLSAQRRADWLPPAMGERSGVIVETEAYDAEGMRRRNTFFRPSAWGVRRLA